MAKKIKTNALRLLDQAKIDYEIKEYEYDEDHLSCLLYTSPSPRD